MSWPRDVCFHRHCVHESGCIPGVASGPFTLPLLWLCSLRSSESTAHWRFQASLGTNMGNSPHRSIQQIQQLICFRIMLQSKQYVIGNLDESCISILRSQAARQFSSTVTFCSCRRQVHAALFPCETRFVQQAILHHSCLRERDRVVLHPCGEDVADRKIQVKAPTNACAVEKCFAQRFAAQHTANNQ